MESASEVMGHAVRALEEDGHIRGPGNLPAERANAADQGILRLSAPSRRGQVPDVPVGGALFPHRDQGAACRT